MIRVLISLVVFLQCFVTLAQEETSTTKKEKTGCEVIVLGVAQDAGFPQAGCKNDCCAEAWEDTSLRRFASCLAVVDHDSGQRWILDCTPDFREQLRLLDELAPVDEGLGVEGIFLTHAHIGHYAGLIHLGREVIGANSVPVFAMPRMQNFLESNGPWDQMVRLQNIEIQSMEADVAIELNERIRILPVKVPHRDEYSETVCFVIEGPDQKALYLPDIDKWSRWDRSINELIEQVDVAFLDGTFFADGEIPGRDMSEIPHPFIQESVKQFGAIEIENRSKINFIHLNHTNPGLREGSEERIQLQRTGMRFAQEKQAVKL